MNNKEILDVLIRARKNYNSTKYPGMCYHIALCLPVSSYGFIIDYIPEFNRKFLVSKEMLRVRSMYWWDIDDYQSRLDAFDKLIDIYQTKAEKKPTLWERLFKWIRN